MSSYHLHLYFISNLGRSRLTICFVSLIHEIGTALEVPDVVEMLAITQEITGIEVSFLLGIIEAAGQGILNMTLPGRYLFVAPVDNNFDLVRDDIERFMSSSVWQKHVDDLLLNLMFPYPYTQEEMREEGAFSLKMMGGMNYSVFADRSITIGSGEVVGPSPNAEDG